MSKTEDVYLEEDSKYLENNPNWHQEDSPWKAKHIHNMITKNGLQPKTVVEIGCGAGEILNQLHQAMPDSVQFDGFDISVDAMKIAKTKAKDRLNFEVHNFLEGDRHYDLSLMIDVFEHVDDYFGFLRAIKNRSTYTIFHIPLDIHVQGTIRNMQIKARDRVGHLHYFTKDTALATLKDCGYEVKDWFYTASSLDLRKNFKARVLSVPRRLFYNINKDFAARLLGGFSIMVLTKNQ